MGDAIRNSILKSEGKWHESSVSLVILRGQSPRCEWCKRWREANVFAVTGTTDYFFLLLSNTNTVGQNCTHVAYTDNLVINTSAKVHTFRLGHR